MNLKKNYVIFVLIMSIVLISVGYAYLSSLLTINGTSSIHDASWNIYFDNVQVTSGSVPADEPEIDSLETTVTYDVTLTNPGDFFEFTVDAVNDGTIDAMIDTVLSTLNNTEVTTLPSYLEYSVTYSDDNAVLEKQELNAGEHETYKVRVGYKKDITSSDLPVIEQNLSFSFTVTYVQKDSTAISILRPVSFGTDSWETIIGAVRSGKTDKYHVGDTKDVDMGSFGVQPIRIINMSTPEECSNSNFSQTGCGFVLEFVYVFDSQIMNNPDTNVGGWPNMSLRTYANTTIYNVIPSPLKEAVIDTDVVSAASFGDTTGSHSLDKIFILSSCEIISCLRYHEMNYVRRMDYYATGSPNLCKYSNASSGYVSFYWTRSLFNSSLNNSFTVFDADHCGGTIGKATNHLSYTSYAFRIG